MSCAVSYVLYPFLQPILTIRFSWANLDLTQPVREVPLETPWEGEQKKAAVESLRHVLTQSLPRDDYRESAELALLLLGQQPPRGVHWLRPGAVHNARWMAKVTR